MHFNKWTGHLEPDDSDFENGGVIIAALVLVAVALVVSVVQCCVG